MWHYVNLQGQTLGPVEAVVIIAEVQAGRLVAETLVWYPGWTAWVPVSAAWQALGMAAPPARPLPPPPSSLPQAGVAGSAPVVLAPGQNPWSIKGFSDKLVQLVGMEKLEGFSLKEMMGSVFKRYGPEAIEAYFSVGLKETTPPLEQVSARWPQPWMFARALVLSLVLYFGFVIAMNTFKTTIALPAVIMTGSFAIPIATLLFFFEMNAPHNVSLYQILKLVLLGGLLSIGASLLLFDLSTFDDWLGPPSAGLIEEAGKLAAVILLTSRLDPARYPYILNGLLFGAAVGTGFAAFESAGYALNITLQAQDISAGTTNIALRGILSPFGHIVWTAIAAGALWSVKGNQKFQFGMLLHKRVLTMVGCSMALHFIWNLPFTGPFLIKFWVLGFIAWVLVFATVQSGLRQLKAARKVEHTMVRGISRADIMAAIKAKEGG